MRNAFSRVLQALQDGSFSATHLEYPDLPFLLHIHAKKKIGYTINHYRLYKKVKDIESKRVEGNSRTRSPEFLNIEEKTKNKRHNLCITSWQQDSKYRVFIECLHGTDSKKQHLAHIIFNFLQTFITHSQNTKNR